MFGLKQPQSIFVHADGFRRAAISLYKSLGEPGFDPYCFAALVANSAFASELYLKCLIHLERGQLIKDEHNLYKLFHNLSEGIQFEIEAKFNAELAKLPASTYDLSQASELDTQVIASSPKTFREALKAGAKAFVEWRYVYETGDTGPFRLFSLPEILRNIIIGKKPEWADFAITLRKVATPQPTSPVPKTPEQSAPTDHPGVDNQ